MTTGNLENVSFVEAIEKERGHERQTGCGYDSWCIRSRGYSTRDVDKLGRSSRRGRRRDDQITLNSPSYKVGITFKGSPVDEDGEIG